MNLDNNKENVSNAPLPSYTLQNLQDDFSKQYTTLNQSVSTIWNIQFACDKYIEVSMYDKKLIDCRQVFRTVKVSNDLTWEAAYGGHKASSSALIMAFSSEIKSFSQFMQVLRLVENCKICKGVNNVSFSVLQKTVYNACGTHIGKMEEVATLDQHGNEQHFHNWRSVSCPYFMDSTMSGSQCQSCNVLRRNLSVQLVRFNNKLRNECDKLVEPSKSKANKRFLSEEDRSDREIDQKRRRINAEKRARYWKFKAAEEKKMRQLIHDDEHDLVTMFNELDKGTEQGKDMFPNDERLSLFWEMQRDAVSKKSKQTSIRWHPA